MKPDKQRQLKVMPRDVGAVLTVSRNIKSKLRICKIHRFENKNLSTKRVDVAVTL
jgi:hypothetical protein